MTSETSRDMGPREIFNENTPSSRLRDFVRINHHIFLGSRVGEDSQEFLDEVYKIEHGMGFTYREKVELSSYQLKDVAQV